MKTVIVTGASKGIGKSTARMFAKEGYSVLINYLHSETEAFALADELAKRGCTVDTFCADVAIRADVDEMVDYCAETFGGIDVLINNAGISQSKLFTDISSCEWDNMMNTNLKGVFNCCQSVLRYMLKNKKGRIINISSIWGMTGASCEVHYSASKAGVIGFTKALAKELALSNIQVNCIAPGIIETDMLGHLSQEDIDELKNDTPSGRIGKPDDIASCALYLADERSSFITGQVISPNGGFVV